MRKNLERKKKEGSMLKEVTSLLISGEDRK